MKKIIFIISIIFNILILGSFFYFLGNASINASLDNETLDQSKKINNYDSINKKNKVRLLELSPKDLNLKINTNSLNKKCVVIFWASWCQYCPDLLKVIEKIKSDKNYNFSYISVSIDKLSEKGKLSVLKKCAKLNIKDTVYIGTETKFLDLTNSKSIYEYLPKDSNFNNNPGFPHIIIFDKGKIIYEDTGFDEIYGISKFNKMLFKKQIQQPYSADLQSLPTIN